jgi:hypothetical protein
LTLFGMLGRVTIPVPENFSLPDSFHTHASWHIIVFHRFCIFHSRNLVSNKLRAEVFVPPACQISFQHIKDEFRVGCFVYARIFVTNNI